MRKIIGISTVLISLFLFSCQDDDIGKVETNSNESKKLNIWRFPVEQVLKHKPNIKKQLDNLKTLKTQAKLTSSTYEFSIEETDAQVIFDDNYTQYTFKVQRENPNDNVLENYICKVFNNGEVQQFLISYPYIENENGIVYDTQNITMQPITDNSLIINSLNARIGCVPEFVSVFETYECENVPCSGGGSSGTHNVGDDCECGVTVNCIPAHTECNWVTTVVWGYNCPNGGIDGSTNDGSDLPQGGNSSTDNTTNPDDEIVTVPFNDEKKPEEECKRIKEFLNTNATFKDSIVALAQTATTATSEKAVMLQSNGTITSHNGVNGKVETPQNPSNSYSASMHIHNGSNTYSIYSAGDLIWTGQTSVLNNKIDTRKFISFLATGKGTYYAFTITNSKKFTDFFNYLKWQKPTITPQERMDYLSIAEKRQKVWDKYYNASPIKIKENSPSTDKEIELEHFIDLVLEGDFGVSVFETDSSFSNFSPLQKNPINGATPKVIRNQCQN